MKKKFLVILISAIMGLQLVGCGNSNDSSNANASNNKPAATTDNKSKVVDNDSLTNDVAEVYLDVKEEYLEVLQNKEMNEWNEAKTEALKDLKDIKAMTPETDKNINQAITDIEQLIDKYQNSLDGSGADPTGIQDLESQIKQLLFDK
ncbi:hypothetical protein [Clostridium sp. LIBA-8841]|uniref:hypothetical protein n=1 Tax=Clostridium sp. LIBA-8841 TaxID=2987530 RepID=UPI002AC4798A|nr:hypothetical protein [Clostridium sp. LIBA-8841]MDZ5254744.1 hypothetical protein [Clostridium sp. LIBA-8841]